MEEPPPYDRFRSHPEQQDLRDSVHEFARDVIRPAAPEYDEKEETPWPIMKQAHELGLDTYSYGEEYGGGGVTDMVTQMIVTEELSWGCAGIAVAINATGLCATAIQQCGTQPAHSAIEPRFCARRRNPEDVADLLELEIQVKVEEEHEAFSLA